MKKLILKITQRLFVVKKVSVPTSVQWQRQTVHSNPLIDNTVYSLSFIHLEIVQFTLVTPVFHVLALVWWFFRDIYNVSSWLTTSVNHWWLGECCLTSLLHVDLYLCLLNGGSSLSGKLPELSDLHSFPTSPTVFKIWVCIFLAALSIYPCCV